jgi:exodeoxyribonuclease VII large subunit
VQRQAQAYEGLRSQVLQSTARRLQQQRQDLAQFKIRMELLSPQRLLERGYSVLTTPSGQVVTRTLQAPIGSALKVVLADGSLDVTVTQPKLL